MATAQKKLTSQYDNIEGWGVRFWYSPYRLERITINHTHDSREVATVRRTGAGEWAAYLGEDMWDRSPNWLNLLERLVIHDADELRVRWAETLPGGAED